MIKLRASGSLYQHLSIIQCKKTVKTYARAAKRMFRFFFSFADEGGEEDSFVGQAPSQSQSSYFQPTSAASDPFAQVGHNPLPPVSSSAPLFQRPPASNTPPQPRDGSPNPVTTGTKSTLVTHFVC